MDRVGNQTADCQPASLPLVLIVEDTPGVVTDYRIALRNVARVIHADNMEDARELFDEHPDIAGIIMDGNLDESTQELDTLPLITEFREAGFTGPIIAASRDVDYRLLMLDAGCTVGATKRLAPEVLLEHLQQRHGTR